MEDRLLLETRGNLPRKGWKNHEPLAARSRASAPRDRNRVYYSCFERTRGLPPIIPQQYRCTPPLALQESSPLIAFHESPTRMVRAKITSMRWANNVGIDDMRMGTKWVEPEIDGLLCAEWIDPETGLTHGFQADIDFILARQGYISVRESHLVDVTLFPAGPPYHYRYIIDFIDD